MIFLSKLALYVAIPFAAIGLLIGLVGRFAFPTKQEERENKGLALIGCFIAGLILSLFSV